MICASVRSTLRCIANAMVVAMAVPVLWAGIFVTGSTVTARTARSQEAPPPPEGYSRYLPGQCLEAIMRTDAFDKRDIADTLRYDPSSDTLTSGAIRVGVECAAQFSVEAVEVRDLLVLGRLYLAIGNEEAAAAAFQRRLDLSPTDTGRAHMLASMVAAYANARPGRMPKARTVMDELQPMTAPNVALWKFAALEAIAMRSMTLLDTAVVVADFEAAIAAAKYLARDDKQEFAPRILQLYTVLAHFEARRALSGGVAKQIMARARADLNSVPDIWRALDLADASMGLYGTVAPPLQATTWISDSSDSLHRHPAANRVSLIVPAISPQIAAGVRRLSALVPDGIDVAAIHVAYGYFRRRGPVTPEEEVAVVTRYVRDELHSPYAVAVEVPQYVILPDERRIPQPTRNELSYGRRFGVYTVVVDRQGAIRGLFGGWDGVTERQIEELVVRLSRK